ncbi:MAG: serine/threonine protein kinase, partial [Kiritimatiellia bacterium]
MASRKTSGRQRPIDIERLGRYRLVRPLSKGGMALVYEGRRESLAGVSPRVAVKLILPEHADSDTFQELFINEARLGASMHHQNLVQIQDFDRDGDHFFLVMEYVEGLTLRQVVGLCVRHEIPIPLGVIAELGRQACDGLHYAHEASDERGVHLGLVHRDVKPSNLMLNPQGVVKILDFGISKGNLVTEKVGAIRGTWGYMAPEQAFGRELGPNADVFGLATILYEMASRKALFRKKKPDEIKRLLDDDHAARMAATLPDEYGRIVGVLVRALQRDPAARYATASDFGRSLSMLLPD